MKRVTKDDIVQSIGVQSDFMIEEILRTSACRREWRRAVAFVADHKALNMTKIEDQSPRMRRLIDLLSVADPMMLAYGASRFSSVNRLAA